MQMLDVIQFLVNNPEVLNQVKNGTASLIGVNPEQTKAILDVFLEQQIVPKVYYWQ